MVMDGYADSILYENPYLTSVRDAHVHRNQNCNSFPMDKTFIMRFETEDGVRIGIFKHQPTGENN